jgi:hypothetical protein
MGDFLSTPNKEKESEDNENNDVNKILLKFLIFSIIKKLFNRIKYNNL